MKKVGILAFAGESNGGIFQYTHSMIDALKYDKTNNYIIFCYKNDSRFDNYGLEVRKLDIPKYNVAKEMIRLFQLLFLIKYPFFFTINEINYFKDIDLFISPMISPYPHFFLNKPFVFTLHDMQERYYPHFFSTYENIKRYIFNKTLAKSSINIICESNFVKNDIIKFTAVKKNKVHIIKAPPPEELLYYKFDRIKYEIIRKKYNLPQKYIFYPAQCWPHKNHIKLVEAFKIVRNKIDNIFLILTGSQKNNYNNLIRRIDELNLNDEVKHLGYIDYDDLPYLYKMSHMLIMPTLFESISIPIYEAFALKVPVCSSNVAALPEQVGNGGIIFNPNDIEDIAQKIMIYLNNKNLAEEKALQGYKNIIKFDHNMYREKLLKVIKKSIL